MERGYQYEVDERSMKRGVLRLTVQYPAEGRDIGLRVTYPDAYPYFRFEVEAPSESFCRHQNPLQKNLCLLERRSDAWEIGDTIGSVLERQMPQLLRTAGAGREAAPRLGDEDRQAEPFSAYFPIHPGSILVDGAWELPPDLASGFLQVGLRSSISVDHGTFQLPVLQGAVLRVLDDFQNELAAAPQHWKRRFAPVEFTARWVRVAQSALSADPQETLDAVRAADRHRAKNGRAKLGTLSIQLWAAIFGEEHRYRDASSQGWLFVAEISGHAPPATRAATGGSRL